MTGMVAVFDVVILGAGSGGYACALRAAQLGLTVALIEKDKVGGTCLHRGCIPTKAILHAAEVADTARDAAQFGVHATVDSVDLAAVRSYADGVVNRLYRGLTGLVGSRNITGIEGQGRLVPGDGGPLVQVGQETFGSEYLVLASGSYPRSLASVPIDGVKVLTSDHAVRLETLPASAIVLGGGVIGVEFASAWRSLGVEVTIVEALSRLVPAEEPEVSAALQRAFRKRKIAVLAGSALEAFEATAAGVRVTLASGTAVEAEILLVAVGRGPATDDLGCDEAGIQRERGWVSVTDRLQTAVPHVYAVGDIVAGPQLAHRGFAHGVFVAEDIAFRMGRSTSEPTPVNDHDVPRVTYSHPEIASVGLTEVAAREQYGEVETLVYDLSGNGKSQILKTQGFVKLIRRVSGAVVGVHMIGDRVSELVGEAQLITGWEAYAEDVATLIHAHPTQHEALGEAHLALAGKPLHTHG